MVQQNNIQVSYSCFGNMVKIFSTHNNKMFENNGNTAINASICNCQINEDCPP